MNTLKQIRFVVGLLLVPFLGFSQVGVTSQGLSITVPANIHTNETFLVTYNVYHNFSTNVTFTITNGCNQCSPIAGSCTILNLAPSTHGTCTVEYTVNDVPGANVTFTATASFTNPDVLPPFNLGTFTASNEVRTALPVELIYFTASKEENVIKLDWLTASEIDNEGFLVEKSQDGSKFTEIGKVNGAGTTFEQQTYTFIDEDPGKGIAYYRLKQMDFDGSYEYSEVVSVALDANNDQPVVYPNPVNGMATLKFTEEPKGPVAVKIFNTVGVEMNRFEIDEIDGKEWSFDVSDLAVGTYFIHIENGSNTSSMLLKKL